MNERCAALEPLHSAWVDGELRTVERARLGSHLQRCARCRASVQSLRITQTMIRSLPPRHLPDGTVGDRHDPLPRRRRSVGRIAVRSTVGAMAAAVMIAAAAFAAGGETPGPTAPVEVDVYVASHLGRTVGGAAWTPALLKAQP